jgi:phenylalanyl-tRNA synthetase alpha chain
MINVETNPCRNDSLIKEVDEVKCSFASEIQSVSSAADLENIRIKYVGKKGLVGEFMRRLREVAPEAKKDAGARINALKESVESTIAERQRRLVEDDEHRSLEKERVDITLPGVWPKQGHLHPITQLTRRIVDIFWRMGFEIAEGPEVESDYLNFESLNIPKWHPARDMQDSFLFRPGHAASHAHVARADSDDAQTRPAAQDDLFRQGIQGRRGRRIA